MTPTREQIEIRPDEGRADFCVVKLPEGYYRMPRRFADLALSAFDMRERAAKVCEERAADWDLAVGEGSEVHGYETAVLLESAMQIRALPTPEQAPTNEKGNA